MVRDISCKNCDAKLGWIYEFATEESQRYKEGRVILERALVRETEGEGDLRLKTFFVMIWLFQVY